MKEKNKIISLNQKIIPNPVYFNMKEGFFKIINNKSSKLIIFYQNNSAILKIIKFFENLIKSSSIINFNIELKSFENIEELKNQIQISFKDSNQFSTIIIKLNPELELLKSKNEGYLLRINANQIELIGTDYAGIFYGIQTLRQLLLAEIEIKDSSNFILNEISIPCCEILDYPRFKWRGFMLDVSRHFFGKEIIKKIINILALLKFNIFHLHLTDDQGWRIEIKKYPKLTEIGAWRKKTEIRHSKHKKFTDEPHGGFFTQDDMKEIIEFANNQFINIVPEIEIPGHSQAAIAAYPNLTCFGDKFEVATTFGIKNVVYCPGKDSVFEFWKNVLKEVIDLFPSQVIHTGGDEVPKERWKKCLDCQKRIKELNLKNEEELQVYVTNTIANYLASYGRRLIGWNEILNENLEKNAICHYWAHDEQKVIEHLNNGRDVVVSKNQYTYLDYSYKKLPLSKVYSFNPLIDGVKDEMRDHILGIEYPLWTEWVPDEKKLQLQAFPRLIAGAEVAWTKLENKKYEDFINRLRIFETRLNYLNIAYTKFGSLFYKIKNFLKYKI